MPTKRKKKPAKQLTAAKREQIAKQAKAAVDAALDAPAPKGKNGKTKPFEYPGMDGIAMATWDLKRMVDKACQQIYDKVLSQTIIKLQHARRKNII